MSDAANLLVGYLDTLGVEYVFGVPGGAIEPLYDALAKSERGGGPRSIVARHETGAAFMADGYARTSGKIGVCCSTAGPGATNLITGVASAYENNIPLLVITAQTRQDNFGLRAFQESADTAINTVGMFQFCTVYSSLVSHIQQFERKLFRALGVAVAQSGPVHLSIPSDVFRTEVSSDYLFNINSIVRQPKYCDTSSVEELYGLIEKSKNTVFVLGGRVSSSMDVILRAVNVFNALVITTPDGKGCINPFHSNYRGVIGFAGHRLAFETLSNPDIDLIVAVGTSLSEWSSGGWDGETLMNDRLVHIETADYSSTQAPMAKLRIQGDIESIFILLLKKFQEEKQSSKETNTLKSTTLKKRSISRMNHYLIIKVSIKIKSLNLNG